MSITTTTHLNFRGDARAALEFYQAVFVARSPSLPTRTPTTSRTRPRPPRSCGARSRATTAST